jgi:hypothetical protein
MPVRWCLKVQPCGDGRGDVEDGGGARQPALPRRAVVGPQYDI